MRLIDIAGPIENGMWNYGPPYPEVRVEPIPSPEWIPVTAYSHWFAMSIQHSTYLETSAHLFPDHTTIDQIPLDRCFMDAVVLQIPKGADEHITGPDIRTALAAAGEQLRPGDALLVGSGWDQMWNRPDFISHPPHFTAEAIYWLLDQRIGLLGADTPRFDDPREPQGFFPELFRRRTMILAPAVNLGAVRRPRCRLIALPLKITGTCASPVRAVLVEED